eukprot:COSAG01_NODE_1798_length_9184_cov_6.067860_2_plen_106_part_00
MCAAAGGGGGYALVAGGDALARLTPWMSHALHNTLVLVEVQALCKATSHESVCFHEIAATIYLTVLILVTVPRCHKALVARDGGAVGRFVQIWVRGRVVPAPSHQ